MPNEHDSKSVSYPAKKPPLTLSRWILEKINQAGALVNIRIDTLTVDRREAARLRAVDARSGFTKEVYVIPSGFENSEHKAILDALSSFKERFQTFEDPARNDVGFQFDNPYYPSPDAEVLYAMVRNKRPRRILEIGCGNSTRITRQAIIDGKFTCNLVCIDPSPRLDVVPLADEFLRAPIEDQDAGQLASTLDAGDFLFIDTSHEVFVGNDCAHIYSNLLPRIRPGVIVHIHDIFLPYEYPKQWVVEDHCNTWGEQYLVHALLSGGGWKVHWPGHYLSRTLPDFARHFPHLKNDLAQSLWIEKL